MVSEKIFLCVSYYKQMGYNDIPVCGPFGPHGRGRQDL